MICQLSVTIKLYSSEEEGIILKRRRYVRNIALPFTPYTGLCITLEEGVHCVIKHVSWLHYNKSEGSFYLALKEESTKISKGFNMCCTYYRKGGFRLA